MTSNIPFNILVYHEENFTKRGITKDICRINGIEVDLEDNSLLNWKFKASIENPLIFNLR